MIDITVNNDKKIAMISMQQEELEMLKPEAIGEQILEMVKKVQKSELSKK